MFPLVILPRCTSRESEPLTFGEAIEDKRRKKSKSLRIRKTRELSKLPRVMKQLESSGPSSVRKKL